MDRHEWAAGYDTEFAVDRLLYPEGIFKATGTPAPPTELVEEILRLAQENVALKSGLRAWKKETVAQIKQELEAELKTMLDLTRPTINEHYDTGRRDEKVLWSINIRSAINGVCPEDR